jgi:hypothetical protein
MKLIYNKTISFLSGYVYGLTETDLNVRESFGRVEYFQSENFLKDIKTIFNFQDNLDILDQREEQNHYSLETYITQMLFCKPFDILSENNKNKEVLKSRRNYSAFHIVDLLNIGILDKIEDEKKLTLFLVYSKKENKKYLIFDISFSNKHIVFFFHNIKINGLPENKSFYNTPPKPKKP